MHTAAMATLNFSTVVFWVEFIGAVLGIVAVAVAVARWLIQNPDVLETIGEWIGGLVAITVGLAVIVGAIFGIGWGIGWVGSHIHGGGSGTTASRTAPPYHAAIPGPNCDKGDATWNIQSNTTATCKANDLQISQGSKNIIGEVDFWPPSQGFSPDNSVAVTLDSLNTGSCGGMLMRRQTGYGTYGLFVCADGDWEIMVYAEKDGTGTTLDNGQIASQSSYTLTATSKGASESLTIGNALQVTVNDATYLSTDYVALAVQAGPIGFKNFTYTALPTPARAPTPLPTAPSGTPANCSQVAEFVAAGHLAAPAGFANLPFPTSSIEYVRSLATVGGYHMTTYRLCAPVANGSDIFENYYGYCDSCQSGLLKVSGSKWNLLYEAFTSALTPDPPCAYDAEWCFEASGSGSALFVSFYDYGTVQNQGGNDIFSLRTVTFATGPELATPTPSSS